MGVMKPICRYSNAFASHSLIPFVRLLNSQSTHKKRTQNNCDETENEMKNRKVWEITARLNSSHTQWEAEQGINPVNAVTETFYDLRFIGASCAWVFFFLCLAGASFRLNVGNHHQITANCVTFVINCYLSIDLIFICESILYFCNVQDHSYWFCYIVTVTVVEETRRMN